MRVPDPNMPTIVKQFQNSGYPTFILTSRGQEYRYATLRELFRNGYNFAITAPQLGVGTSELWMPYESTTAHQQLGLSESAGFDQAELKSFKLNHPRLVNYTHGVFFTAGQHKGVLLRAFLRKANAKPKAIVFVDDNLKHCERVQTAFKYSDAEVITIHYTKLDPSVDAFENSDKRQVINEWEAFQSAYKARDKSKAEKLLVICDRKEAG
ncbi:MAG: DUF2608 domain-containing protein [Bdellovibrionota bacterium]